MTRYTLLLPAFLLLISCSTITATVPLTEEFKANADKVTLEAPVWRATDGGFNMPIGKYRSDHVDVSWSKASRDPVGEQVPVRSFYGWMNSDQTFQTYNVDKSQSYGFDLFVGERQVSDTQCAIFSNSKERKYSENDFHKMPVYVQEGRRDTFLSCVINHQSSKWELTLAVDEYGKMSAALHSDLGDYSLESLGNSVFLDETGKQVDVPGIMQKNKSGLTFLQGGEQVAAVSFAGVSTFWVRKKQSAAAEELLYSANFALTMFNWIDSKWR